MEDLEVMRIQTFIIWGFPILLVALAGCSPDSAGPGGDLAGRSIRVVATTGMVADAVRDVGGDRVEVEALMGPGVDPHLYKASEGDVTRMARADVIFYNGLHLEGKLTEVFEQMERRHVRTVAVTGGIDPSLLLSPPEFEGAKDPHVWFDVSLWMMAAQHVRDALIDPDTRGIDLLIESEAAPEVPEGGQISVIPWHRAPGVHIEAKTE